MSSCMDMVMELPTEYMDSSQVYLSAFSVWVVTETLFALFCRIIFGLMTLTCDLLSLNKLFLLSFFLMVNAVMMGLSEIRYLHLDFSSWYICKINLGFMSFNLIRCSFQTLFMTGGSVGPKFTHQIESLLSINFRYFIRTP